MESSRTKSISVATIWDAIEKISNYLRQREKKMNELEILNFTLEAFFSSLDKVTCADDFLVESLNLGSPQTSTPKQ